MANPQTATLSLIAAVSNGIALSQTPTGAGLLTLAGSLVTAGVATFDVARRVVAVSANAGDTTQTITITGTDRYGNPQSEVITLNGTTPVYTNRDFLTVTGETISAATAGAITSGTNGVGSTSWIVLNPHITPMQVSEAVHIISGSVTFQTDHTYDDPQLVNTTTGYTVYPGTDSIEWGSNVPPVAWPDQLIQGKTTDTENTLNAVIYAIRLTITAGTGKAILQVIQAGIRQ